MITLITTLEQFEERVCCASVPFCMFCDLSLSAEDLPMFKLENSSSTVFVHKQCYIAFTAQLDNEREKVI
jgi:hypothetical protein